MSQTHNSILTFSGRRPTLPEILPSPGERGRQHETEPVSFPKFYEHSNYYEKKYFPPMQVRQRRFQLLRLPPLRLLAMRRVHKEVSKKSVTKK